MNIEFENNLINYALKIGMLDKTEDDNYVLLDKNYHYDSNNLDSSENELLSFKCK